MMYLVPHERYAGTDYIVILQDSCLTFIAYMLNRNQMLAECYYFLGQRFGSGG